MLKYKETVYYYQPKPDKHAAARKAVMLRMGIRLRMLEAEQLREQVGFVAGLPGFQAQEALEAKAMTEEGVDASLDLSEYTEDMLLFQGFSNLRLDQLLKQFNRAKLPKVNLKAVLTSQNANWTFAALYQELKEEHTRMHESESTAVEAVEAVQAKETT